MYLRQPTFRIGVQIGVLATLLSVQLPAIAPGKQQLLLQELEFLSVMWDAHAWRLWPLKE